MSANTQLSGCVGESFLLCFVAWIKKKKEKRPLILRSFQGDGEREQKDTRGCLWSSVKPELRQRTKGGPASRIFICGRKQQVYRRHIKHIMQ